MKINLLINRMPASGMMPFLFFALFFFVYMFLFVMIISAGDW